MRDTTVARNYAETLFELAEGSDAVEEYGELVEAVRRLLDEVPRFRLFLETPKVEAGEKKELLRAVFGGRVPADFLHFLLITVDKRRQRLLREIADAYRSLLDEHLDRATVEVTLAREPDEALREELTERLSSLLGKTAMTRFRVRPGILGGVIVRTGDQIFDGSLRRQMKRLRGRLLEAEIPADVDTDA